MQWPSVDRAATKTVAPAGAQADYVCKGADDDIVIQKAIDSPAQARSTGRTNKTVSGTRRQTVIVSVLESLRQHPSTCTLPGVIEEIRRWSQTGRSCFARWAEKLGLTGPGFPADGRPSLLDRVLPVPGGALTSLRRLGLDLHDFGQQVPHFIAVEKCPLGDLVNRADQVVLRCRELLERQFALHAGKQGPLWGQAQFDDAWLGPSLTKQASEDSSQRVVRLDPPHFEGAVLADLFRFTYRRFEHVTIFPSKCLGMVTRINGIQHSPTVVALTHHSSRVTIFSFFLGDKTSMARWVIGIDREEKRLQIAKRRISRG